MLLKLCHRQVNGGFHGSRGSKEVVVESGTLQVAPQPFNGIELRAVLGQPDHERMRLMHRQEVQDLGGGVVGGIVQDQDQEVMVVALQQLAKEIRELRGVLLGVHQVVRLPAAPVEGPIDAAAFVGAGGWYLRANPSQRPHLGQGRVEVNLTLVEVQQVEVRLGANRVFFRKSSKAFFPSYS